MTDIIPINDPHMTCVPGFHATGVACGIKPDGALDLALLSSSVPCTAAAVFTTNCIKAAPVLYDQALIAAGEPVRAVVINSGNANACTGEQGLADTRQMAQAVGQALAVASEQVFVMSTGVIGAPLPMERILSGIAQAASTVSAEGGHAAAQAIMTTDTHSKEAAVRVEMGGKMVTIAGMCKGSGMIHPNMATMLATIITDADVSQPVLDAALRYVVERTFNAITVDGDTSTNDTLLLLANAQAGNPCLEAVGIADYEAFVDGLMAVATELSWAIVRDAEGASKFVTIQVCGALTESDARQVAKSIAHSPLVKTALYGQDANWGRIICAAGYSGIDIDPQHLNLWLENEADSLHLVCDGAPFEIDEERAAKILAQADVTTRLDLGLGMAEATVWTCDLTHKYVDINAHYRT